MVSTKTDTGALAYDHFAVWLLDYRKWLLLALVIMLLAIGEAFGSAAIPHRFGALLFWSATLPAVYVFYVATAFAFVVISRKQLHGSIVRTVVASIPTVLIASQFQRAFLSYCLGMDVTAQDRVMAVVHYALLGPLLLAGMVYIQRGRPRSADVPAGQVDEELLSSVAHPQGIEDRQLPAAEPVSGVVPPLYLASDDHHVKIVFADRVEITRSTLKQEMQRWQAHGLQVHRSYWVNTASVSARHRRGRQMVLELTDGMEIPVGRSFEKEVIEALQPILRPTGA